MAKIKDSLLLDFPVEEWDDEKIEQAADRLREIVQRLRKVRPPGSRANDEED